VPVEHRDADGAVPVYNKIVALRPDWHSDDPDAGRIKVVMTGSASDPAAFQPHLHPKDVRKRLKLRVKNPTIRWRSSSSETCGSPVSTPPPCTRCTSTSPCRAPG
jgi:hypothetical protein